jgi:hypothetical protein
VQRDFVDASAAGLRAVGAISPPGTRYTPRSLRSGGVTAAYAAGVPLERIMRVSNHVSRTVVLRHYRDLLVSSTPAARVSFDQSLSAALVLPVPASSRFVLAILSFVPPSPICFRVTSMYLDNTVMRAHPAPSRIH